MAKWKCEICGSEFENFYAQGFNHQIYCPLCYFKKENKRLLELCMYALIRNTKIYNHELDNTNKLKFINTIRNNLNDDTYTLRNKLIDVWEGNNE